jgi:hypothetical protein
MYIYIPIILCAINLGSNKTIFIRIARTVIQFFNSFSIEITELLV